MTNYKNLNFDIASPVIKSDILDFDFAAGEDLALSSWAGLFGFYINSIDYTDKVIGNSLKIGDFLTNRIDTATFTAVCALADAPAEGQEVSILISGDRVFGGYITKANRKRLNTTILKIDCQARDFSILLLNKLVAEAYTNQTAKYIIEDLINLYCGGFGINTSAVETGPTIASIKFNYISVYEAIKKIATQTGYEFYIDAAKVIHYYLTADNPAPFDIDDNSEIEDAEIEKDLESCVNSIYVRGGTYESSAFTQNEKGNGTKTDWPLTYKPHGITVTSGGAAKTVGTDNLDNPASYDCLVNYQEKILKFKVAPADGAAIVFIYTYDVPIIIYKKDYNSIAALEALGFVNGIREKKILDTNIKTTAEARKAADAELEASANPTFKASYTTRVDGLKSGMSQRITLSAFNVNQKFTITEVNIQIGNNQVHKYDVTLEGRLYGFIEFLSELKQRSSEAFTITSDEILDKILSSYETITIAEGTYTKTIGTKYGTARYGIGHYE